MAITSGGEPDRSGSFSNIDEFDCANVERAPSRRVRPSRVLAAGVSLECAVHQIVQLPDRPEGALNTMVIGDVVGVHIADEVFTNDRVDIGKLRPIGRLGYSEYVVVDGDNVFSMRRPE